MVKRESPAYLFIGQDNLSKNTQIKKIKEEFLDKETAEFNVDLLYGKELALKMLQERLLCLPIRAKKRIIIIKEAQNLSPEIKNFLPDYIEKKLKETILILDIDREDPKDTFINFFKKYAYIYRLGETQPLNIFDLTRQVEQKKIVLSLKILHQLLMHGERPEVILGSLRSLEKRYMGASLEKKRKLKLLLNCDIEIKTGRLKPVFALEKLIVRLCS